MAEWLSAHQFAVLPGWGAIAEDCRAPGSGNPYNGLIRAGGGIPSGEVGLVPRSTSAPFQSIPPVAQRD